MLVFVGPHLAFGLILHSAKWTARATARGATRARFGLRLSAAARSFGRWRARIRGIAGALHAAEHPIPPQIDAVVALAAQVVGMAAETHVHHVLVAHLVHKIDGR